MLIDTFVVRTGFCCCDGMLKSERVAAVVLIQVKVTCLIINTRCPYPVFFKTLCLFMDMIRPSVIHRLTSQLRLDIFGWSS